MSSDEEKGNVGYCLEYNLSTWISERPFYDEDSRRAQ
jgi:hypothetical protein